MRLPLLSLLGAATVALLASGCTRNVYVPQTTPQFGLQLRVKLPPIGPKTALDTVRTVLELVNTNDEPYTVSSPGRSQISMPVVRVNGQVVPWTLRQRRSKDVRITIPPHSTYRTTYDLPLSVYAGGSVRRSQAPHELQVFYHGKVYAPKGRKAKLLEIPSNRLTF